MNQIYNKNDRDTVDLYNPLYFPVMEVRKEPKKDRTVDSHAQFMRYVFQKKKYRNQCKEKADSLWMQCIAAYKEYTVTTHGILNKKEYDGFVGNFDITIANLEQQLNALINESKLQIPPSNPTPYQHGQIRIYSIVQPISDNIKSSITFFKERLALMKNEIFLFGTQRV